MKLITRLLVTTMFLALGHQTFAAESWLKIKASPGPVSITIDGQTQNDAGDQWQVYEVTSGRHTVRAEKENFTSQTKKITIGAGEVEKLVFTFERAEGFKVDKAEQSVAGQGRGDLTIITDKPGATVTLNGREVTEDVTPITIRELGEGEWDIKVSLQGKSIKDKILIQPGRLATVRFFFDPKKKQAFEEQRKTEALDAKLKETATRTRTENKKKAEDSAWATLSGTYSATLKSTRISHDGYLELRIAPHSVKAWKHLYSPRGWYKKSLPIWEDTPPLSSISASAPSVKFTLDHRERGAGLEEVQVRIIDGKAEFLNNRGNWVRLNRGAPNPR